VVEGVGEKKKEEEEKRKKGGKGPFIPLPLLWSAVCRTIRTLIKPQFSCEPLHKVMAEYLMQGLARELGFDQGAYRPAYGRPQQW
jgi:hypothetical protein